MAESLASVATDAAIVELIMFCGNDDIEAPCTTSRACPSMGTPQGGSSEQSSLNFLGGSPTISFKPFSLSGKRRLVQRMASCDGPIACHALQGYLERCFLAHTSYDAGAPPRCHVELEQWMTSLLDGALDCCKPDYDRRKSQRLRSAIYLMELCSTVLKAHGRNEALVGVQGGHAPRVRHELGAPSPSPEIVQDKNGSVSQGWDEGRRESGRRSHPTRRAGLAVGVVGRYMDKLLEAAGELMRLEHALDARHDPNEAARLGGEDAAYWALVLVSEVLRFYSEEGWAPSAEQPAGQVRSAAHGAVQSTRRVRDGPSEVLVPDASLVDGSLQALFDLESLVRALCAIPLVPNDGSRSGSWLVDLALKWLEVTELLVNVAAQEATSVFHCLCDSVPRVLWQLTDYSRSILGSYEPPRPAGQAFVDERGADGTMLQAMLRLVFKIVKVQLEQGWREAQKQREHWPKGAGADDRVSRDADMCLGGVWRTPADVITGTFVERSFGAAEDAGDTQGNQEESDTCIGSRLVQLFCEQDDMLVDMLLTNLHIYRRLCGDQAGASTVSREIMGDMRRLYEHHLHPAVLFSTLLSEVGFDSRLLLDWLISPETSFLAYLTLVLRLALADWPDFVVRVSSSSSPLLLDKKGIDDDDDDHEEEAVVLSEEGTVRLTRVMDCLSALASSARGLEKRGLLPYDLTPMLKRIKQVQDLFEDCECAEDGDGAATA